MDTSAYIAGELTKWPTKARMAELLRSHGLQIEVGRYSIRVISCSYFVFQEYGGDLGPPQIEADAESAELMHRDAALVSDVLASERLKHRFEIYDFRHEMVGYLHYSWPLRDGA